jgi:hypothetical protein
MYYVEVDVGKWKCRAAIMDQEGIIVEEFTFKNDIHDIKNVAKRLSPEDKVVMKSTSSVWMSVALRPAPTRLGFTPLVGPSP